MHASLEGTRTRHCMRGLMIRRDATQSMEHERAERVYSSRKATKLKPGRERVSSVGMHGMTVETRSSRMRRVPEAWGLPRRAAARALPPRRHGSAGRDRPRDARVRNAPRGRRGQATTPVRKSKPGNAGSRIPLPRDRTPAAPRPAVRRAGARGEQPSCGATSRAFRTLR